MAMQKKEWMTCFLFKEFLSFLKQFILDGMSTTKRHLLVLDGLGSHVTLEAVEQDHELGSDMIILHVHTFHALQALDVSCFKLFKTTFQRVRDLNSGQ
jgi:hypothetical protein